MNASFEAWLKESGLEDHAGTFREHDIDLDLVDSLTEADLEKMGLSLGVRKRFLKAVGRMRGDSLGTAAHLETTAISASSTTPVTEGERRQLTVLFCDLVGYTELSGRVDPEVLQQIVRVYEDTCAVSIMRYEGYVYQRLGDGIVAFFGYPLAHEGEAERAIHAGLSIIEALGKLEVPEVGRLRVRIGIAAGLVVVASVEKGAVGETMNLAARLQGIAPVGTLVVSERVRQLAGGRFEYEDLGEQTLKGFAHPTHAYQVRGISSASSRFEAATQEGLTPLVGREQELGLLLERWGQAREGEGQAVLLSGEPGIGKSRILSALRKRLEAGEGAQSLRFQCSPYHVNSAFYPSIENLERALKFGKDEAPDSRLDKLEALMVGHYGRPKTDVRFIATMLSISAGARFGPIQITPQRFKDETLRALVDITEAAARKQPSVMLFEDVHWADPTTLEVLDLLVDRTRHLPLLIVLTHRPEFQNRWASHGHVTSLNLSKLTRAQSAAMVSRVAKGKALPGDLLERILAKTDGIPLFVEELTKAVLESKDIVEREGSYEHKGDITALAIPATLRDSLMARLDRNPAVKEVAQMGAVIGREFSYELVAALTHRSREELDKALSQLTDAGLAFRRGTPPQATYLFKHALVQDAAYDSLLKSKRQELHAKIARAIEEMLPKLKETEPEILAHHLTEAGQIDAAVAHWQKAGDLAITRLAFTEALNHLWKGLHLIPRLTPSTRRDESELALRSSLGIATFASKGWAAQEVTEILQPALALAQLLKRTDAFLPIISGLFWNVCTQGRAADSMTWARETLRLAEATGNSDLLITGHLFMSAVYYWIGNYELCLEHRNKVEALYDDVKHYHLATVLNHDPKGLVGCYAANVLWMMGYPDQAARVCDEKNAHGRRRGHPFDQGFALTAGSEAHYFRGDVKRFLDCAGECERLGQQHGLPVLWALLYPQRAGMGRILEGRTEEGVRMLQAGMQIWEGSGGRVNNPLLKSTLAIGVARLGDVGRAEEIVDAMIGQIERLGWEERLHYAEVLRIRGWLLTLKNDAAGAEKYYRASIDWAVKQKARSWELRSCISLAQLWQSQGKRREAYGLLTPVYAWFTEGFDTKDLKDAKALLEALT